MLVQEKLLRVIEYGELERVGGSQPLQVNVRLVCATNANLPEMVAEDKFRADLLDRLAFDVVQLPPLREREATSCCWQTSLRFRCAANSDCRCFPASAIMRETLAYHWPGNIRELKNVVERSVYRHGSSETELDNIILDPFSAAPPVRSHQATPHAAARFTPVPARPGTTAAGAKPEAGEI
jgi:psp operon transcriptional activator